MKARMSIKNIIFVMTAVLLASMFFINISFAANTGKISVDTAKLREQPSTDAKVLELISKGEEINIIEEQDGWYKAKYKDLTGYVRADLIETSSKAENEPQETTNEQSTEAISTEVSAEPVQEEIIEKGKQYKIVNNVKLKTIPLISAIPLDEVAKDAQVEVVELLNGWAKIKTTEGKQGWIREENLTSIQTENPVQTTENLATETEQEAKPAQETKKMYVNAQTINVREQASKSSKAVKQLTLNTEVTVMSTENGWSYVEVNGIKGYISESLLSSTKQETSRSSTTERETTTKQETITNTVVTIPNTSSKGNDAVALALQFKGKPYVSGGTSPSGFDCSGLTYYVYKCLGVTLNRTAAGQYSNGVEVTKEQLQPGDLVMFYRPISHVGIYVGGGQFIHAANSRKGVIVESLSGYYSRNFTGARRIF